jgi:hypothetical protein
LWHFIYEHLLSFFHFYSFQNPNVINDNIISNVGIALFVKFLFYYSANEGIMLNVTSEIAKNLENKYDDLLLNIFFLT